MALSKFHNHLISALTTLLLLTLTHPIYSTDIPPPHDGEFPMATLHNGQRFPMIGLGSASGVGKQHILSALSLGYRHIDTAQSYSWGYREHEVGQALTESTVSRNEIFVQSKIHPEDLGYQATKKAFDVSLQRLSSTNHYMDSILLHKPHCWEGACTKTPEGTWQESWVALEELYDAGLVRSIGICDVDNDIMDQLLRQKVKPHVIQNWMDPFHQDKRMRERCQKENIQYQAYSSLGTQWLHHRGHEENPVLTNPTLLEIASLHNRTVAQVVINWATRHGVAVIPASTNSERQELNLNSFDFDISEEEMKAIDSLDGTVSNAKPDPNKVSVLFQNAGATVIESFFVIEENNEMVSVGEIGPNDSISLTSYHGHKFVFKDGDGVVLEEYIVAKDDGPHQVHAIFQDEF